MSSVFSSFSLWSSLIEIYSFKSQQFQSSPLWDLSNVKRIYFIFPADSVVGLAPVSSLIFNRFSPVFVLASVLTNLAIKATSLLGQVNRDLQKLTYREMHWVRIEG